MASQEDSSVISNVIFFHATLAPIDGGAEEWLCLISIKERRRWRRNTLPSVFLYEYVWFWSSDDLFCDTCSLRTWWTLCNRLWILMTILKEITVSPMYIQRGEKNNSSTRLCSCTRSQVAPRLVLNLNFTVLSLFSSLEEDDDALDPFKLEVW